MNDFFTNQSPIGVPETLQAAMAGEYQLLETFNNTSVAYPADKTVIDLFENQVHLTPNAFAVAFREQQLTYAELNTQANQLAHYLKNKGVGEEMLVPICVERSPQMIIGILGILKAGAAYVPIDPDYPEERVKFILEDTQATIAVGDRVGIKKLQFSAIPDIIDLDEHLPAIQQQSSLNIVPACSKTHHLAYIIYTSGSTGKPKGVMIEHKGLVNLALSQAAGFGLKPGMKTLQFASFGFDASCSEIFTTLLSAGCLVLPQKKDILSAEHFEKLVNKHIIEVVTLPTSYQLVVKDNLGTIKTIISAGEPLNETTGRYLQSKGIRLLNAYGPTENTVCVSMSDDPIKSNHTIVIGKPIANVKVYILDKEGDICPIGVAGEICVAGVQVARGYLNRPELTAEKFVLNPFAKEEGDRMYKTGDLGKWLPDGNIEFLGRLDDQVKIRGYRIEPGEIEKTLHQCELVSQAVVIAKADKNGSNRLIAYIVPKDNFNRNAIVTYLKERLPEYMVPALLIPMQYFRLTASGKIDKKSLPDPETSGVLGVLNKYVAPRTDIEQKLVTIWQKLFDTKQLGVHDNFFDLGGNSLMAIQIVSKAKRAGYHLQPTDFFIYQNIEALARLITERSRTDKPVRHRRLAQINDNEPSIIAFNSQGTKVPFFFMSPGFSVYDKVFSCLDEDQPFYFFIPFPYKSVEEIATYYIQEMKKIQPTGPYCLGGYCGFGEVALEMAQQLSALGDEVTFLALFEFYFPTAIQPVSYKERFKYYYTKLKNILIKEKALIFYGILHRKIRKLKRRTSKVIDRKIKNLPETTGYLIGKNLYSVKTYNGKVLLFRSNIRTAEISDDPYMGWFNYFTGQVELYTIDGDHKTMFIEPGAAQIASKLKAHIVE